MHQPKPRPAPRRNTALAAAGQHAERCPHCRESYVYELEARCVDCDGAICPLCVVRVRGALELRCPTCHAEHAEHTEHTEHTEEAAP